MGEPPGTLAYPVTPVTDADADASVTIRPPGDAAGGACGTLAAVTTRPDIETEASALSPGQAGLRFLVEIAAVVCWGIVGWQLGPGALGWVLAVVLPLIAATAWGTFRVPGDRSANGNAPVAVPGAVRLMIELDVLLGAAVATILVWRPSVGVLLALAVVAHYAATTTRVRWLLAQRA